MPTVRRAQSYSLFPTCPPLPPSEPFIPLRRVGSASSRQGTDFGSRSQSRTNNTSDIKKLLPKPLKRSQSMDRVFPLKLKLDATRRTTISNFPDSPTLSEHPSNLTLSPKPKRKRPGPVTDLIILPYTEQEFRIVMDEVKRLFEKGQYKHCTMRCKQVLESIKDPHRVHPLYGIYLSFYAATALEQSARVLHHNSSRKLPLFHEALSFYQKAEQAMEFATFTADPSLQHASRQTTHQSSSSITSSIRSSVSSVFSDSSNCSSRISSLSSDSIFSPGERDISPHRRNLSTSSILSSPGSTCSRNKKKVSFSDLDPLDKSTLIAAFPCPPSQSEVFQQQQYTRASTPDLFPILESEISPTSLSTPSTQTQTPPPTQRYLTLLTSLQTQLTYHIESIHTQISLVSSHRSIRRSNSANLWGELAKMNARTILEEGGAEEIREAEIKERIRRGRENGWERRRFKSRRYEELCERAEEEIVGLGY